MLNALVQRTMRQFPWYTALMSGRRPGESADALTLSALPLITAEILEKYYYTEANALHMAALSEQVFRYHTSGTSSGRRKEIFYSVQDEAVYLQVKCALFQEILDGSRRNQLHGAAPYMRALVDMGTGHAAATAIEVFDTLGLSVDSVHFTLPVAEHLAHLSLFKPQVLYTMPSILDRILDACAQQAVPPASFGIRHIILVGEMVTVPWLQHIARQFHIHLCDITDTLGSIEVGTIAYFSHAVGRYLFAAGICAEGIGALDQEEVLAPDEQLLVLTSAQRTLFPVVRYVTYDVVQDLREVEVEGKLRQSFARFVRRIGSDQKHGEKISLYDIEHAVFAVLGPLDIAASVRVIAHQNTLEVSIATAEALSPQHMQTLEQALTQRVPAIGRMIEADIVQPLKLSNPIFTGQEEHDSIKRKLVWMPSGKPG